MRKGFDREGRSRRCEGSGDSRKAVGKAVASAGVGEDEDESSQSRGEAVYHSMQCLTPLRGSLRREWMVLRHLSCLTEVASVRREEQAMGSISSSMF